MDAFETRPYRFGRKLIIAEAAFEYLINILVTGSFLARLTTSLGFSDSLTGIISAISSLGCIFQLASLLIKPKRVKPVAIACTFVSEFLFLLLYVIPGTSWAEETKTVLFIGFLTLAYLSVMLTSARKMNWFMSLVDDRRRGQFTANKEIISLAAGIVYSYLMGRVIDSCRDSGSMERAFAICAVVIFILLVLQLLCQIFTVEASDERASGKRLQTDFKSALTDQTILSLTFFLVLYRIGTFTATAFYGTYQIKELGFSQTMVVSLTAVGSLVRMAFSPFMGRFADRHSFARMERICLAFMMVSFIMAAVASPENGKLFFALYNVMHGIALAGANSAITNLIFDMVPPDKRADALAFTQAVSGVAGFLATLAAGWIVGIIQAAGNTVFGIRLYAQQFTSILAAVIMGVCIVYVSVKFIKNEQKVTEL